MPKVFLSHNSKDKPKVRKIADVLIKEGIEVWIDEVEMNIGDPLIEKIAEGIKETDCLIAFISANSVHSNWVQKELKLALTSEILEGKVQVLPVVLDNCEIPFFLLDKLYADFRDPRTRAIEMDKLIRSIYSSASKLNPLVKLPKPSNLDSLSQLPEFGEVEIGKLLIGTPTQFSAIRMSNKQKETGFYIIVVGIFVFLSIQFLSYITERWYLVSIISFIAGLFLRWGGVLNLEAFKDKNTLILGERTGAWSIPFGKRWMEHYKIGQTKTIYMKALYIETIGMLLALSLIFFILDMLLNTSKWIAY